MQTKKASPLVVFIIGIIFIAVGGCIAFFFGKPILDKAKASESWPSTQGTVLSSEVVRSRDSDGDTMYAADVVYSYSVNDQIYESSQIKIGPKSKSSSSSGAYKVRNKYPKGSTVTVYYDPNAPEEAALEAGVSFNSYIILMIGLVFFGVGCLIVLGKILKLLFIVFLVSRTGKKP